MTPEIVNLNVLDNRQVDDLAQAICDVIDTKPDNIVLAALADVVALCCEMADEKNPEALLDALYSRAIGQFHAVYTKRATPKDSVTPLTRPEQDDEK
jgi:hypothetical protein